MTVRFATVKKTFDLCQETLLKESISIRITFKLLGKFASSFQALKDAEIHYSDIQRLKINALRELLKRSY